MFVRLYQPDIPGLFETKYDVRKARTKPQVLGYPNTIGVDPYRQAGGIWLGWKSYIILYVLNSCKNYVWCRTKAMYNKVWAICFVYGAHNLCNQPTVWETIQSYMYELSLPTLLMGDFNQVEFHTDKSGGSKKIRGWEEFTYRKMNMGLIHIPFYRTTIYLE